MRTNRIILFTALLAVMSCGTGEEQKSRTSAKFGVHEVIMLAEMPSFIVDSMASRGIHLEENPKIPFLGYIHKDDSYFLSLEFTNQYLKLIRSALPVDPNGEYYAIVGVKKDPAIDNSAIRSNKAKGLSVEVYLNSQGAKQWADITSNNIDRSLAIVLDDVMYATPYIGGKIKNGVVRVEGFDCEDSAKKFSNLLNQ